MEANVLASVIERAKRLEAGAFDALVDEYGGRLFGYLYRLTGDREAAEDLLQELFVRLVRTLPQYEHDGRFEGWIFRIATNLARDRVRRGRRAPAVLSIDGTGHDGAAEDGPASWQELTDVSGPAPEGPLELREDADALQRALGRLPGPEREVVMLRHFSELSFVEIAEAMGTPLGTALARAHRGLSKLREMMEDRT
ncbi:MAG TPA: sigma-70 family RNA polymerase sigma factor [Phycisphaerae bacterium]|nr:sigma-70 family RNA polymerase sigma factor [Phycisphaerae bacterium]